jgi:hypothetical protein
MRVVASTDAPVRRWMGGEYVNEIIPVGSWQDVKKVPLLDAHSRWSTDDVKGSAQNFKKGDTFECDIIFSSKAEDEFVKAKEGHIDSVSVGYDIREYYYVDAGETLEIYGKSYTATEIPSIVATKTVLRELSLVPIGADEDAKIRGKELENSIRINKSTPESEEEMNKRLGNLSGKRDGNGTTAETTPTPAAAPVAQTRQETTPAANPAPAPTAPAVDLNQIRAQERARVQEITVACRECGMSDDFTRKCIDDGISVDAASALIVKEMRAQKPSVTKIITDKSDNFREIAPLAFGLSCGIKLSKEDDTKIRQAGYGSIGLQGLARSVLDLHGINTLRMDNFTVASALLGAERAVTSDYVNVLANVFYKTMDIVLQAQAPSYMQWTKTVSLKDFKASKLTGMGVFSLQTVVDEGTAPNTATRGDAGESITLKKLHDTYVLSFEAITNDDQGAFMDTASSFALAGPLSVNKAVYRYLMANAAIGDTKALFHVDHGNLKVNGEPFSILGCDAGMQALMVQANNGVALNIRPRFVIVPVNMYATAAQLLSSPNIQIINQQHEVPANNPFAAGSINPLQIVTDSNLADSTASGYDANQWFMSADPIYGGICVGTLNGQNTPIVTSRASMPGEAAGIIFDSKFFYDVACGNYRALYKNDGGV